MPSCVEPYPVDGYVPPVSSVHLFANIKRSVAQVEFHLAGPYPHSVPYANRCVQRLLPAACCRKQKTADISYQCTYAVHRETLWNEMDVVGESSPWRRAQLMEAQLVDSY